MYMCLCAYVRHNLTIAASRWLFPRPFVSLQWLLAGGLFLTGKIRHVPALTPDSVFCACLSMRQPCIPIFFAMLLLQEASPYTLWSITHVCTPQTSCVCHILPTHPSIPLPQCSPPCSSPEWPRMPSNGPSTRKMSTATSLPLPPPTHASLCPSPQLPGSLLTRRKRASQRRQQRPRPWLPLRQLFPLLLRPSQPLLLPLLQLRLAPRQAGRQQ